MEGTDLWAHPELYMYTTLPPEKCRLCDQDPTRSCELLNLGNPDAREWATTMVSDMVSEANLSWYRQDFNNTLPNMFWEAADANSSVQNGGISEALHIGGLYRFWDDLRVKHRGLSIDNCASGGRRIDLETLRRSLRLRRCPGGGSRISFRSTGLELPLQQITHSDRAWDLS